MRPLSQISAVLVSVAALTVAFDAAAQVPPPAAAPPPAAPLPAGSPGQPAAPAPGTPPPAAPTLAAPPPMAPPPPVALPQAPAATLTPDSALGLQSSDVVMEKKDVFVWYPATENDAKLEWNRRDAWRMVRFDASLGTEMVHFLAGPDAIAGTVGSTMLLRIGAPYAGVVIGTYLPGGNLVAGMEFARELALPLVDFGLPDVQLGMVFINPGARYVGNTDDVHTVQITTASPGLRLACCDLVKVDARVGIPQIWIGGFDSTVSAAVSWGFSLDAGVIF